MSKEELLKFLQDQFPQALGFALTGSQAKNHTFNTVSDIDIVVFDTVNSNVYSIGMSYQKHRFDFTILPILDIENVVLDEFYDPRGIVLNMIGNGIILKDTNNVIKDIQNAIEPLLTKTNIRTKSIYQKLIIELLNLRKYLKRDLDENEKLVLACDFVYLIIKIEVIRLHGWEAVDLRKVKLLKDYNPGFVEEITKLHRKATIENNTEVLIGYINHYHLSLMQLSDEESKNIVFDIAIPDFSFPIFCEKILSEIIANPSLKNCYKYFYLSPLKLNKQYKNNISICFKPTENITVADIISELSNIKELSKEGKTFSYEFIHPLERFRDDYSVNAIEELRINLCEFARLIILNEKKLKARPVDIALALCSKLKELLILETEDVCYLNNFLMQRWLLSPAEQKDTVDSQRLVAMAKEKQKVWDIQYNISKQQIQTIINNSTEPNQLLLAEHLNSSYLQLITKLEQTIQNPDIHFKTQYLPDSLLEYIKLAKPENGRVYLVLAEEIFQMLNMINIEKAYILYMMSKGMMELYFIESK